MEVARPTQPTRARKQATKGWRPRLRRGHAGSVLVPIYVLPWERAKIMSGILRYLVPHPQVRTIAAPTGDRYQESSQWYRSGTRHPCHSCRRPHKRARRLHSRKDTQDTRSVPGCSLPIRRTYRQGRWRDCRRCILRSRSFHRRGSDKRSRPTSTMPCLHRPRPSNWWRSRSFCCRCRH
jgi:hypothetical protein